MELRKLITTILILFAAANAVIWTTVVVTLVKDPQPWAPHPIGVLKVELITFGLCCVFGALYRACADGLR